MVNFAIEHDEHAARDGPGALGVSELVGGSGRDLDKFVVIGRSEQAADDRQHRAVIGLPDVHLQAFRCTAHCGHDAAPQGRNAILGQVGERVAVVRRHHLTVIGSLENFMDYDPAQAQVFEDHGGSLVSLGRSRIAPLRVPATAAARFVEHGLF